MNIEVDKSFDKDIDKINDKALLKRLKKIIQKIENANNIKELPNLKKMIGYKNYYRIRISSYRISVQIITDSVILLRFLSRKDIYKYFP